MKELRNNFDKAHTTVTPSTATPDKWTDRKITASTNSVISFGTYSSLITLSTTGCLDSITFKLWSKVIVGLI